MKVVLQVAEQIQKEKEENLKRELRELCGNIDSINFFSGLKGRRPGLPLKRMRWTCLNELRYQTRKYQLNFFQDLKKRGKSICAKHIWMCWEQFLYVIFENIKNENLSISSISLLGVIIHIFRCEENWPISVSAHLYFMWWGGHQCVFHERPLACNVTSKTFIILCQHWKLEATKNEICMFCKMSILNRHWSTFRLTEHQVPLSLCW